MRHIVQALEVKKSVAIGAVQDIKHLEQAAVYFGSTDGVAMNATVKIQGQVSGDGLTFNEWVDIATPAQGSITQIPNGYTRIRMNTTAYVSGQIQAAVSGKESRSGD